MTTISYVSGLPGLGKTHWVVRQLQKAVLAKQDLTIYVAPTKVLLRQVMDDVRSRLLKQGLTEKKIERLLIPAWRTGGSTINDTTNAILKGSRDSDGVAYHKVKAGSVLFMTHAGFMLLRDSVFPGDLRSRTTVYFDEAKKMVFTDGIIKSLPEEATVLVNQMFVRHKYGNTAYERITLSANHKKLWAALDKLIMPAAAKAKLRVLCDQVDNPRLEIFAYFRKHTNGFNLYQVRLPERTFLGYKDVVLLSAYFEHSQMYALLKAQRGIELQDITAELPKYAKRIREIRRRYGAVELVPLTLETSIISTTRLTTKVLVPEMELPLIQKAIDATGIDDQELRALRHYVRGPKGGKKTSKAQRKVLKILENSEGYEANPIEWYLKAARRVVRHLKPEVPPLLFLNKKIAETVGDVSDFQLVSTAAHGLNAYQSSNIVVYLAAIHPTPMLRHFLEARLKGYDIDQDHILDVCTQCIGRSSVRDTKSKEKVYVLLPDMGLTNLLEDRFIHSSVNKRYMSKVGYMMSYGPWEAARARRDSKRKAIIEQRIEEYGSMENYKKEKTKQAQTLYRSKPGGAELNRLRSSRSYHLKKGNTERVKELESQIQKLLSQR